MLGLIMEVGGVVAQHDLYSLQLVCGDGGSVVGSLLVRVIFYIFVNPNTLPVLSIILDYPTPYLILKITKRVSIMPLASYKIT
jgi:hypothetical protein